MPKAKNPKADEAESLYREGLKLVEIAKRLDLPEGTIRRWKSIYKWNSERSDKKKANARKKRGAPKGNKNATGAPKANKRAEKYGLFSKYMPEETLDIMQSIDRISPLDLLWDQIQIAYTAIIRAQRLAYVKNQEDVTKRITLDGLESTGYQYQEAWDKHNDFMKAQARAQGELRSLIKQYDEMLHRDWDMATEEQKSRVEYIKSKTAAVNKVLTGEGAEIEDVDDLEEEIYGSIEE